MGRPALQIHDTWPPSAMIPSSVCLLHKRLICPALPQTARPATSYTTSWDRIERGVAVDHSTIFRWVQKYAPEIEKRLRWQWR